MSGKLGSIMVERGLISNEQLEAALAIQQSGDPASSIPVGEHLGNILVMQGLVNPCDVALVCCEQYANVNYMLIEGFPIDPILADLLGQELAKMYKVMPLVRLNHQHALFLADEDRPPAAWQQIASLTHVKNADFIKDPQYHVGEFISACYSALADRKVRMISLAEILLRENVVSPSVLDVAIRAARKHGLRLGEYLVQHRLADERKVYQILASLADIPFVSGEDLRKHPINLGLSKQVRKEYVRFNHVMPIYIQKRTLVAATLFPQRMPSELLGLYSCDEIKLLTVTRGVFARLFYEAYSEWLDLDEKADATLVISITKPMIGEIDEPKDPLQFAGKRIVQRILAHAVEKGASDIHIENFEKTIRIRLRIDGILHELPDVEIDKTEIRGVVNVLKIESELDIAESRMPQGGSFRRGNPDGHIYDFRVQIMPSVHGECVVIRILPPKRQVEDIEVLGLPARVLKKFQRAVANPSGLILITGPTGSGKTTTLCASLSRLASNPAYKILTVEDPMEYSLPGVVQTEILPAKGIGFAEAARAFMRMDPDIILIGEIRDNATALEALRLSSSGHLIFATLHTSTAVNTIERMCGFGLDRYHLVDEMVGIMNQRLIQKLCPFCRKEFKPDSQGLQAIIPFDLPHGMQFYESQGCEKCGNLGHKGRILLTEYLSFGAETRSAFRRENEQTRIFSMLQGSQLECMVDDALIKVNKGLIDIRWLPEVISQDYLELGYSKEFAIETNSPC
jgi:type IV pilus assembly protein PilB